MHGPYVAESPTRKANAERQCNRHFALTPMIWLLKVKSRFNAVIVLPLSNSQRFLKEN